MKINKRVPKVQSNFRIEVDMEQLILRIAEIKGLSYADTCRQALAEYIAKNRKLIRENPEV